MIEYRSTISNEAIGVMPMLFEEGEQDPAGTILYRVRRLKIGR
jgi:hypothetical protein